MLVTKGKNVYLYTSSREDGVVTTRYQGKLSPEQIHEHHKRSQEQALRKQQYHQAVSLLADLDAVRAVHDVIIRAGLLLNHQYVRRSEIRSMKHG